MYNQEEAIQAVLCLSATGAFVCLDSSLADMTKLNSTAA
jgi:hypothetical protein